MLKETQAKRPVASADAWRGRPAGGESSTATVQRNIVVEPAVVNNLLYVAALLEQLGRPAAREVCTEPAEQIDHFMDMLHKVLLLGLLALGFLLGWLARSCLAAVYGITPTQTAPTAGRPAIDRAIFGAIEKDSASAVSDYL